jgi:hypothetical protein
MQGTPKRRYIRRTSKEVQHETRRKATWSQIGRLSYKVFAELIWPLLLVWYSLHQTTVASAISHGQ